MPKIGRNAPCPCGSGKKYKKCCLKKDEASAPAGLPKVMTASGEQLSFWQARYDLVDCKEALSRLDQAPDFDRDEPEPGKPDEISFAWLEASESAELMKSIKGPKAPRNPLLNPASEDGPFRLLGDLKITGDKLSFNTTGEQRFALGKKRLESLLGSAAKHRIDSMQSMESALAERSQGERMDGRFKPITPEPLYDVDPNDPNFAHLAPGETLQDALKSRQFRNVEEVNQFLSQAMGDYNHRPQEALGGLSPVQVRTLLDCDWEDPDGPMVINQDLTLDDLKGQSAILSLAYALLATCDQIGGIKATKAGYLNTTFVLAMTASAMADDEEEREDFLAKMQGRFKERDNFPLFLCRMLCQQAGFLELSRGRFRLTESGRDMLDLENGGKLFIELFLVHFLDLNLDSFDPSEQSLPSIQHTLTFSLYALSQMTPGKWYHPTELYPALLLPTAKLEVVGSENPSEWSEDDWWRVIDAMDARLLDPLAEFGLIEEREVEQAATELDTFQLRPTPLLKKFISFNLWPDAGPVKAC